MIDKKNIILKTASELFLIRGIRNVSMDDISKANTMSKKTLYTHFKNKYELIEMSIQWSIKNPKFQFTENNANTSNSIDEYIRFYDFVNTILDNSPKQFHSDLQNYYPKLWANFTKIRKGKLTEGIVSNIKKGVEEGIYRSEINIEFVSIVLVSFFIHTWQQDFEGATKQQNRDYHHELTIYHLRGICNTKGIEYLEKNI